jgi:hypothetical protein
MLIVAEDCLVFDKWNEMSQAATGEFSGLDANFERECWPRIAQLISEHQTITLWRQGRSSEVLGSDI